MTDKYIRIVFDNKIGYGIKNPLDKDRDDDIKRLLGNMRNAFLHMINVSDDDLLKVCRIVEEEY